MSTARKVGRSYPMEMKAHAKGLLDSGVSYKNVADMLGVSCSAVRIWHPGYGSHVARHPDDVRRRAEELLDDGMSYGEVGRTLGVSPRLVSRWHPDRGWGIEQANEYRAMRRAEITLLGDNTTRMERV